MAGGGITVFRRGVSGGGVNSAVNYALEGGCDAGMLGVGVEGAVAYSDEHVERLIVGPNGIVRDELDEEQLRAWIDGSDPLTGEQRGRRNENENSHLFYDLGVTAQKSYSLVGVIHPELKDELDSLMKRVAQRQLSVLASRLESRMGAGGRQRIGIEQFEVVRLSHEASRSLDPHRHEHLWIGSKVRCTDGKWRALDSTQLLAMSALMNAERAEILNTDEQWREALARYGYTLDENGEIEELAHAVRHMSKRNAAIAREIKRLEREWRESNPHHEPSAQLRATWDRLAWAKDRPAKNEDVDPTTWRERIREELLALDPTILERRLPEDSPRRADASYVDVKLLVDEATEELNNRAQRHQDRVSLVDIEAMAIQTLANTCLIFTPEVRHELRHQIIEGVLDRCELLTEMSIDAIPSHVRVLRARVVGDARREVISRAATRAITMNTTPLDSDSLIDAVLITKQEVEQRGDTFHQLNTEQIDAVRAIAGKASLVTVEGPAGTGKTTMLTVAERALRAQGRSMHVFAPAKNAALVAEAEIGGVKGNSLHALLHAHGYTWTDNNGFTKWTHRPPQHIPAQFDLSSRDVIVVDEAGMVDMHAMRALTQIADNTGAKLVLVGDPFQITPVGSAGAMGLMQYELPDAARVTLGQVHRFRNADGTLDESYARYSLALRTATTKAEAQDAASYLTANGHVIANADRYTQLDYMARQWMEAHGKGESVALMASRNEDVDELNALVKHARIKAGHINPNSRTVTGERDQTLHVGDKVRSTRNERFTATTDIANGETWTIQDISDGKIHLYGGRDNRHITIPVHYSAQLRLCYASTLHAAQGQTVTHAYTLLDESTSAEQLYVGMSRGKRSNTLLVGTDTLDAATEHIEAAIMNRSIALSEHELKTRVADEIARAGRPLHMISVRDLTPSMHIALDNGEQYVVIDTDETTVYLCSTKAPEKLFTAPRNAATPVKVMPTPRTLACPENVLTTVRKTLGNQRLLWDSYEITARRIDEAKEELDTLSRTLAANEATATALEKRLIPEAAKALETARRMRELNDWKITVQRKELETAENIRALPLTKAARQRAQDIRRATLLLAAATEQESALIEAHQQAQEHLDALTNDLASKKENIETGRKALTELRAKLDEHNPEPGEYRYEYHRDKAIEYEQEALCTAKQIQSAQAGEPVTVVTVLKAHHLATIRDLQEQARRTARARTRRAFPDTPPIMPNPYGTHGPRI